MTLSAETVIEWDLMGFIVPFDDISWFQVRWDPRYDIIWWDTLCCMVCSIYWKMHLLNMKILGECHMVWSNEKICVIHMCYICMYIYICIHMFTCTEVQCQLSFRYAGITITKTGATYRRNTYHTSSTKIGDLKKRMGCRWIVNGAMAELRKDTQGVHTSNFHNKTWEELNPLGISRCYGP